MEWRSGPTTSLLQSMELFEGDKVGSSGDKRETSTVQVESPGMGPCWKLAAAKANVSQSNCAAPGTASTVVVTSLLSVGEVTA